MGYKYSWEPFHSEKALSFGSMAPGFPWQPPINASTPRMIRFSMISNCHAWKPRQLVFTCMYTTFRQIYIRLSLHIFTIMMFVHTLCKYACYVCYVIVFQHQRTVHTIAAQCCTMPSASGTLLLKNIKPSASHAHWKNKKHHPLDTAQIPWGTGKPWSSQSHVNHD